MLREMLQEKMARRGVKWHLVVATGLALMLLVAPEVVGFASSMVYPDGLQTESLAVVVQRKEVTPFVDGYKEVFYADIYGHKNTKWKGIYYYKNGVWKKSLLTMLQVVRL
ncbi:MAG: hypothetical protein KM312_08810 [Hydrogenibacillus schlegelii]|uniref:Uncharacterized protein n=1 Tax=Hydrogenibacillus schlegelii TaxID=1484 RepID=A0A947CX44_HYDSH|nr:hypothetical protein [Hydrogenibacillus schlegelii]